MRRIGITALAGMMMLSASLFAATGAAPVSDDFGPCVDDAVVDPEPATTEAQSPPGIGTIALKDTLATLGAPLHWDLNNWLVVGGIAAGVAAVGFAFDIPMRNKTQAHQTATLDDLTRVVEPFGAEYSWAVVGAYGVAGFVFRDAEAKDIFFDSAIASILASGIITPTLKFVIGRERPNETSSSTSFHPFTAATIHSPPGMPPRRSRSRRSSVRTPTRSGSASRPTPSPGSSVSRGSITTPTGRPT